MRVPQNGAQRASSHWSVRLTALTLTLGSWRWSARRIPPRPPPRDEGRHRGRSGRLEHRELHLQRQEYASQARSYGATVVEIYSPNATWSRVKDRRPGRERRSIYLGHGNGYPSPYGAFSATSKDGLGLNATAGARQQQHQVLRRVLPPDVHQARPELGRDPEPALLRLGQLRVGRSEPDEVGGDRSGSTTSAPASCAVGAKAVFAEGITSASWIIYGLFRTGRSMATLFAVSPDFNGSYDFQFSSTAHPGVSGVDGPARAVALLPLGHRQPESPRIAGPRRLIPPRQRVPARRCFCHPSTWCAFGTSTAGEACLAGCRRTEREPRCRITQTRDCARRTVQRSPMDGCNDALPNRAQTEAPVTSGCSCRGRIIRRDRAPEAPGATGPPRERRCRGSPGSSSGRSASSAGRRRHPPGAREMGGDHRRSPFSPVFPTGWSGDVRSVGVPPRRSRGRRS